MWETLDLCINVVDTQSLELLVPRLAQMVRSGVGLNTRFFFKPSLQSIYARSAAFGHFFYSFVGIQYLLILVGWSKSLETS